ncbi:MAG: DNA helicase PcrA [Lachnospiraceae bacterium]|jgi:DNA helicase-2/ATP-dependent DNA helicase PcrA|nr:DNA helicase PcrA [Lachnospiraceae bacterium]
MDKYGSLNSMQREAVAYTEGPLLILAGAGSGKTRVLTYRAAYLIEEKGVNPYHIMAITFTNKAAGEMRERMDKLVGFGSEGVWVSTFHSTCVRILRRYIDRIGYGNSFTIYDADDQKAVMKDVCRRLKIDTKVYKEKAFLAVISQAKDRLVTPEEFTRMAAGDFVRERQAAVYQEYQSTLQKSNALDFDDLIGKAVELFEQEPEVLANYQERFRYLMVDEYQDTNTAQFRLISLLAAKYRNLCVVGDDDQSIYKFRGADIRNILSFEEIYPDARVIKLEQNYRSTQNILDAANGVISNNISRKAKALWTENGQGSGIDFQQLDTAYEEADYVIRDIQGKTKSGGCRYGDCAILYRTNAQSRLFEERLVVSGMPYRIVGSLNFYARKEIKDLLAYLKTIDNGSDDLSVRRIINIPKRGIGATTIGRVQAYAEEQGISFYNALRKVEEIQSIRKAGGKVKPFVNFIQAMRSKLGYLTVSQVLQEVIEGTGYVKELEAENTEEARARIENIDELLSKAIAYEETEEAPSLSGFLEEVALVADIDSLKEGSDYVVLMTLHSAKGLEFPYVYLAGMEDGLFPSYMSIASDDLSDLEEERRLCYVGITRAMEGLAITCARQRMIRGEMQYNTVSRFVREIPKSLLGRKAGEAMPDRLQEEAKSQSFRQAVSKVKPIFSTRNTYQARDASFPSANTRKASLEYQVGDRVAHMKFGEGVVAQIVEGGRDFEVTVDFDRVGTKKMFATFAKLKKV